MLAGKFRYTDELGRDGGIFQLTDLIFTTTTRESDRSVLYLSILIQQTILS